MARQKKNTRRRQHLIVVGFVATSPWPLPWSWTWACSCCVYTLLWTSSRHFESISVCLVCILQSQHSIRVVYTHRLVNIRMLHFWCSHNDVSKMKKTSPRAKFLSNYILIHVIIHQNWVKSTLLWVAWNQRADVGVILVSNPVYRQF